MTVRFPTLFLSNSELNSFDVVGAIRIIYCRESDDKSVKGDAAMHASQSLEIMG